MNTLEALRDDSLHAQQVRTLGRPVTGRSRAVLLAGQDDQRHLTLGVFHAGVKDTHLLTLRQQARYTALGAGRELVAQTHVGKGPAHHGFVIAAARAVAVEVGRLDAVLGEILPGWAARFDVAGR